MMDLSHVEDKKSNLALVRKDHSWMQTLNMHDLRIILSTKLSKTSIFKL